MRWFRTLRWQFVVVVAGAVILSNITVVAILEIERAGEIRGMRTEAIVERVATSYDLLGSVTPSQREQAIEVMSNRFVQYWVSRDSPLEGHAPTSEERASAAQLADLENSQGLGQVQIQMFAVGQRPPGPSTDDDANRPFRDSASMVLSQQMPGGEWLSVRVTRPQSPARTPDIFFAAGLATILTCAAAAWIAGRASRPLSALAAGADAMSRGESAPRLSEGGPDDVRRAAHAFNAMNDRVTRTLESHRHLLSAVGHDLRTPIAAMRISSEFVDDPEIRGRLSRNLDELQSLTEAVLSAARSRPGEEMRRVDLGALVQSLCDDLSDLNQPVEADIDVPPAACLCRPNDIKRAARNLIENAVRYGGGAHVTLSNGGADYVVAVEDRGPGIPANDLEKVFEPFVRLEQSRSSNTGGSGLGLTLARTIAREHGGDVTLKNLPGGGLRAELRLPSAKAA